MSRTVQVWPMHPGRLKVVGACADVSRMTRFLSKTRGATAVEYALVLVFLVGLTAPLVLGLSNGADAAVEDSADKIGQSGFTDAEDRAGFNPTALSGNYNSFTLLAGDDLGENGLLDDNDAFEGGVESGPHALGVGEILVVNSSPSGGTLVVGPVEICSILISYSPTEGTGFLDNTVTIEFPTNVLGWISATSDLIATDEQYGTEGAFYSTDENRGYEPSTDSVVADSGNPNILTLTSRVDDLHTDQVRIFVECGSAP